MQNQRLKIKRLLYGGKHAGHQEAHLLNGTYEHPSLFAHFPRFHRNFSFHLKKCTKSVQGNQEGINTIS